MYYPEYRRLLVSNLPKKYYLGFFLIFIFISEQTKMQLQRIKN